VAIMFVLHKFVKYLLPQLVIAAVFAPLKARPVKFQLKLGETDTLSWADKPVSAKLTCYCQNSKNLLHYYFYSAWSA